MSYLYTKIDFIFSDINLKTYFLVFVQLSNFKNDGEFMVSEKQMFKNNFLIASGNKDNYE